MDGRSSSACPTPPISPLGLLLILTITRVGFLRCLHTSSMLPKRYSSYMIADKYNIEPLKARAQGRWLACAGWNSSIESPNFLQVIRELFETLPPHDRTFRKAIADLLLGKIDRFANKEEHAVVLAPSGIVIPTMLKDLLEEVSELRKTKENGVTKTSKPRTNINRKRTVLDLTGHGSTIYMPSPHAPHLRRLTFRSRRFTVSCRFSPIYGVYLLLYGFARFSLRSRGQSVVYSLRRLGYRDTEWFCEASWATQSRMKKQRRGVIMRFTFLG